MTYRHTLTTLALTATALTGTVAAAAPAAAGGIGDFLSPAFGTDCANHNTGARADGATTAGTGTANSNVLGLPLGSPLNQCGGADLVPRSVNLDFDTKDQNIYYSDVLQDTLVPPSLLPLLVELTNIT
ncbi:hypothetical protein [Streptomyces sp. NPDC088752]|uniref:hypothetical protein n=1 Tax=Streptomyces sp. NPDC088752 TaxID=3154963 RepID=UPI0034274E34